MRALLFILGGVSVAMFLLWPAEMWPAVVLVGAVLLDA